MFLRNFYKMLGIKLLSNNDKTDTGIKLLNRFGAERELKNTHCNMSFGTTNQYAPYLGTIVTGKTSYGGVIMGDGDTPVTLDDYELAGTPLTSDFTHSVTISCAFDETGMEVTGNYTITNTGTTTINIREVGLVTSAYSTDGGLAVALIERTVLDSPVIIEAGAIGQVKYTIRLNYPTT